MTQDEKSRLISLDDVLEDLERDKLLDYNKKNSLTASHLTTHQDSVQQLVDRFKALLDQQEEEDVENTLDLAACFLNVSHSLPSTMEQAIHLSEQEIPKLKEKIHLLEKQLSLIS